ncbi:MAG: hypothetical protein ACP5MX_03040 [Candidatus Micrarchaeia archaeon]
MSYKKAVFDLDGGILDDINAKFNEMWNSHKGTINNLSREFFTSVLYVLPHSKRFYSSLLSESFVDEDVIGSMKKLQSQGTELYIVTKNKGVNAEWLSSLLDRHGIKVDTEHIIVGDMGKFVEQSKADLAVSDRTDSIPGGSSSADIMLLRRGYNNVSIALSKMLRNSPRIKIIDPKNLQLEIDKAHRSVIV